MERLIEVSEHLTIELEPPEAEQPGLTVYDSRLEGKVSAVFVNAAEARPFIVALIELVCAQGWLRS